MFDMIGGANYMTIREPVSVDDNLALNQILFMFIVDSVIHLLIMWYVEAVFPGNFGIPQKPYFFVLVSVLYLSALLSEMNLKTAILR